MKKIIALLLVVGLLMTFAVACKGNKENGDTDGHFSKIDSSVNSDTDSVVSANGTSDGDKNTSSSDTPASSTSTTVTSDENTSTGNTSTGNASTGNASTGNTSTGNTSTGNASTGSASSGATSTNNSSSVTSSDKDQGFNSWIPLG